MAFSWTALSTQEDLKNGLIKTVQAYQVNGTPILGVIVNVVVHKTVDVNEQRILALISENTFFVPGAKISGTDIISVI